MTTSKQTTSGDCSVSCTLPSDQQTARLAELLNGLGKLVDRVEEIPSGYALVFATTAHTRKVIYEFIAFERQCCGFMTYTLIDDSSQPLTLKLTGPEGTQQFITTWIDKW